MPYRQAERTSVTLGRLVASNSLHRLLELVRFAMVRLTTLLVFVLTIIASTTHAEDWGRFLGPRGDSTSLETDLDLSTWEPNPSVEWSVELGQSYGAPAVVGDRVLQFHRVGKMERLSCYSVKDGQTLWENDSTVEYDDMYGYNNGPRCSPLVDEDRVYVFGVSGLLRCIELTSGKLIWKIDTTDVYHVVQNFFGVASNPIVVGNKILVMVGGSSPENAKVATVASAKPNGCAVVAFDKLTGKQIYRVGNDLASYASLTTRNINGTEIGFAFLRSGLMTWEVETGRELAGYRWRASMLESVNAAVPVFTDKHVFISEAYEIGSALLPLDQIANKQFTPVWSDGGPRNQCKFRAHWSTPVQVDGFLYGCSGRRATDSDFRCVDIATGEVQWKVRQRELASVLRCGDQLVILGERGNLTVAKPSNKEFKVLKQLNLNAIVDPVTQQPLLSFPCWSAPIIANKAMYIRGRQNLVKFDLQSSDASE